MQRPYKFNAKFTLKLITYNELLQRLSEKSRSAVHRILDDDEVHYLIVLQANAESKPKILPAGPNLDFRSPKDASGQVIRGMRAVAYVDLNSDSTKTEIRKSQSAKDAGDSGEQKVRELEAKLVWYENENNSMAQRLRNAKRILKEKDIKISELSKRNEMLTARMDEFNCSGDIATEKRLEDIEKAENELIDRMNELMHKEAQLEQREEDLEGSKKASERA